MDERRLELAEREQVQLGDVFRLVLDAYGLSVSDAGVRESLAEAVRRVRTGDRSPLPSAIGTVPAVLQGAS